MKKEVGHWDGPFWRAYWAEWPDCYCGTCDVAAVVKNAEKPPRFYCWEHRETDGPWLWLETADLKLRT